MGKDELKPKVIVVVSERYGSADRLAPLVTKTSRREAIQSAQELAAGDLREYLVFELVARVKARPVVDTATVTKVRGGKVDA